MKKSIFIALFLTLCFSSCELWNTTEPEKETNFAIGHNTDDIRITTFNPPLEINSPYGYSDEQQTIDADLNGIIDFKFSSYHVVSSGGKNAYLARINVLDTSFQISTIQVLDPLHKCMLIRNDTIIAITYYSKSSDYVCTEERVDSLHSFERNIYPEVYSKGNYLTENEMWENDVLNLSLLNTSFPTSSYPATINFNVSRGNWRNQTEKYLIFRKKENEKIYYGWFKLSIENIADIRIHEYAIQIDTKVNDF